ncbi:MAG: CdaR family protein [Armatimonadetes bacterium]|nr:CdaR family protein [Armatimonadota bacterium]
MRKLLGHFYHNWELKAISLAAALMIWAYAGTQRAAAPSRQVLAEVQTKGSAQRGLSVEVRAATISVAVSGPAAALDRLSEGAVKAIVDVSAATASSRRLPVVQLIAPPLGPAVTFPDQRLSVPVEVTVNMRRTLPVTLNVVGQPPAGRSFTPAQVDPPQVEVFGSTQDVKRVTAVVGSVIARQGPFRGNTQLRAVDRDGINVDTVQLEPALVSVQVDVVDSAAVKTVVISPALTGRPAAPFVIEGVTVSPMTVTLAGPTADIATVTSISTAPLSVEGTTVDATRQVALVIPPGLSIAGSPATVTVTIRLKDASRSERAP